MIESYDFGRIIISGKEYLNDLILFPDKIKTNWFRNEGHLLQMADMDEIFAAKPKILIIGTGHSGVMRVDPEVKEYCRMNDIKLIEQPTAKAIQEYNSREGPSTIGAFHLTC
jgi:hypothetical protein